MHNYSLSSFNAVAPFFLRVLKNKEEKTNGLNAAFYPLDAIGQVRDTFANQTPVSRSVLSESYLTIQTH